jgi:hypothetical protein
MRTCVRLLRWQIILKYGATPTKRYILNSRIKAVPLPSSDSTRNTAP